MYDQSVFSKFLFCCVFNCLGRSKTLPGQQPQKSTSEEHGGGGADRPPLPLPRAEALPSQETPSPVRAGQAATLDQALSETCHEKEEKPAAVEGKPPKAVKPSLAPKPSPIVVKQRLAATLSDGRSKINAVKPLPQSESEKSTPLPVVNGGQSHPSATASTLQEPVSIPRAGSIDSLGYIPHGSVESVPTGGRNITLSEEIEKTIKGMCSSEFSPPTESTTSPPVTATDSTDGPAEVFHSYLDVNHPLAEDEADDTVIADLEDELYGNVSTDHLRALMEAGQLPVGDKADRDKMIEDLRSAMRGGG